MKKVVTVITTMYHSNLLVANQKVMLFWIGFIKVNTHGIYCDTSICRCQDVLLSCLLLLSGY